MKTVSDREQAEELCDVWKHQWKEEYYGYRCENCDMFVPFGCEPWIDEDDIMEME